MRAITSQSWTKPKFVLERALLIKSRASSRDKKASLTPFPPPLEDSLSSDLTVSQDSAASLAPVSPAVPSGRCVALHTKESCP